MLPKSEVVAAFQNLSARKLLAAGKPMEGDVVVCSDHDEAKERVMSLVEVIDGLRAVDGGSLANARYVEQLTALLLNVNRIYRAQSSIKLVGILGLGMDGPRIVVVGVTGSGKTTLARQLAERFGVRHVELDGLNWEANWVQASTEVFRERVTEATAGDGWVVDGNYRKTHDITWPRATMIVWLDYPFPANYVAAGTSNLASGGYTREAVEREPGESVEAPLHQGLAYSVGASDIQAQAARIRGSDASLGVGGGEALRFGGPRETERWLQGL